MVDGSESSLEQQRHGSIAVTAEHPYLQIRIQSLCDITTVKHRGFPFEWVDLVFWFFLIWRANSSKD
jgi:hypothetical protein